MKNNFTIEESIELLDSSIQKEMSEILSVNSKAINFQKLADEKYMEMAKKFEPMLPCKDRVLKIYNSLNEIRLIDRLEAMLIREENIKKQTEDDNDGDTSVGDDEL